MSEVRCTPSVAMVAACVCPLIRLGLNRIEATPSQEGVLRGPRFCRDSLGFQRPGRLSEQLDHPFKTPIGQRIPLLHPLLEQPFDWLDAAPRRI